MTTSKKKPGMKVFAADGSELMEITRIERSANNIVLHGKIMGSLPMKALIKPEQARVGLKLLDWKTIAFLPSILFRKSKSRQ